MHVLGSTQTVVAPPTLSVSLVDTQVEFNRLQETWNRLLLASPRPVPFLTWEWLSTWWEHFHGNSRLFVLVGRDGNQDVVGLAPLKITVRKAFGVVPVRIVEFLGYRGSAVCTDHLDFLTSSADRQVIIDRLTEGIFARRKEWDAIVLADVAEDSLVPDALVRRSIDEGLSLAERPPERCPFITLAGAWEAFLSGMTAKRRWQLKRRRHLLESHGVHFVRDICSDGLHAHLKTLARLHELARRRKGERGNFRRKAYRDFHHEVAERMARKGYLYLARLDFDEGPVAAWYGFYLGQVLFFYQAGFDTAFADVSVGDVLQGFVVQDAIERLHAAEFDFLRGPEEYKYRWTPYERRLRTVLAWQKRIAGRISEGEFLLRRGLSPWKQRVRTLWRSAGQRFRSPSSHAAVHTSQEKRQL